ncbi:tagatose 1,6-diphosphate aldolase [uncultured Anaerococcus sp.]|mgnify:CR=1 FL=1|uniref:tagatose 1,6-diphosphate aldolase n=1 Tax=uncultured Anaerococcus sp. TaxID=293428 RepID=UPI0026103A82|nr:tagatose 1,6-diphosphate aldolase [uncultured Anaerococcus sp.]
MKISKEKYANLKKLVNSECAIAALAIDQRGSMEKMMNVANPDLNNVEGIGRFKELVSSELTKYASSILLDPIYGMKGVDARDKNAGLIMSYEQTGYDEYEEGRLPRLIDFVSGLRIKEMGSNAVKVLLYYDIDEDEKINDIKKAWVERVGFECQALGLPYFLEIVNYDASIDDAKGVQYSKLRPEKVIESMKVFDDPRYKVDVLKVEAPVNMNFVEGFADGEVIHSREEAMGYFKEQSDATSIPFIFLSGGVSADLFKETLKFAKEAGSTFNGVLCGRATWRDAVEEFAKSEEDANNWLQSQGKNNIVTLNEVIKDTATSVFDKIEEE